MTSTPSRDAVQRDPYRRLAERLDALPNGYPPTPDGVELRLLAKLFTPEEASLAASLRPVLETPAEIAARIGGDAEALGGQLKRMARRGLIKARRAAGGLSFSLLPFVVGIYEMQGDTIDAELAQLFEDYYRQAFGAMVSVEPQVHRVIPVNQAVRVDMEVRPYESAAEIVAGCRAWGVVDCICRKQQALIGKACEHPLDVCLCLSTVPGAFDGSQTVAVLTQDAALATLRRAAEAGLVHTVSNSQDGLWYICNCCTCGCAILRGMADLGMANVVARSAFVNQVDEAACLRCELCLDRCQFGALTMAETARVDRTRCVGCGACVIACPEGALTLVRRPDEEVLPPPATEHDWQLRRASARRLDFPFS